MSSHSLAQGQNQGFQDERAAEDYSYLKDSSKLRWTDAIKFMALGPGKNSYLSIGGSYRPRFERFSSLFWTPKVDAYYSQRASFHADLHLGPHLRFFGELQHGLRSGEEAFPQSDVIDLHQGFVELSLADTSGNSFVLRAGRQEMSLGAGRLIDLRIGPNARRSFDMFRAFYRRSKFNVQAFYGKEVQVSFDPFDNAFSLFDGDAMNPVLWGVFGQFVMANSSKVQDRTELYYIGSQSNAIGFNDVMGAETRHSFGIRRFGSYKKKLIFNTELIFQLGEAGDSDIRAFNFETDWKYSFLKKKWRPTPGIKFDWSSGDREAGDGRIQSFNPLFVNPAIYSLAAVNTPVNLLSVHPSLLLFPAKKWLINLEFAFFYRSSRGDGVYIPPSILLREAGGLTQRHIGNVAGIFISYSYNKHISIDLRSSYFIPGAFIEASGPSEPIFHLAPTLNFLL